MLSIGGAVLGLFLGVVLAGSAAAEPSMKRSGIIIGPAPDSRSEQPESSSEEDSGGHVKSFDEREIELAFWSSVRESSDPADFEAYLDAYPEGAFARLARNRLAALEAAISADKQTTPEKALAPDLRELARMLQVELRRVGCNPGKPDGRWGPRSRRALERFNREAGTGLRVDTATAQALDAVRSRGTVCRTVVRQRKAPAAPTARRATTPPAAPPRSETSCTREEQRGGAWGGRFWMC